MKKVSMRLAAGFMGILLGFNLLFSSVSYATEDMTTTGQNFDLDQDEALNGNTSDSASEGVDIIDPSNDDESKEKSGDSGDESVSGSGQGSSDASSADNSASEDASIEDSSAEELSNPDESDEASSEDSLENILDEELTEEAAAESSDAASLLLSDEEGLLESESKLLGASSDPYSGSCGVSATWKFDPNSGVLTISGSGAMDDYEIDNPRYYKPTTTAPWFQYTDKIKDLVISDDITHIGAASFVKLKSNKNVFRLSSKLKSLGNYAFLGFEMRTGAEPKLIIPGTLTHIPDYCFYKTNVSFGEIVLEEGVKSVGENSFENAGYRIVLPNSLTTVGADAFNSAIWPQTYTIPKGIKKIGKRGFWHLQYIKVLTFEGDMPEMEEDAFGYNSVIVYYNPKNKGFSDAEREKASQYFGDVTWKPIGTSLEKKAGPNITWSYDEKTQTLRFDGSGAMYNYSPSNLPDWYIHANRVSYWYFDPRITEIGDYCFYHMGDFREGINPNDDPVILPQKLTRIGKYAFCDDVFYHVTMPLEVERIEEGAFYHNSLTVFDKKIVFPKKVKYIGKLAFYECRLMDAHIDLSSIEYIGEKGLDFRTETKNVTCSFEFPDSLKYIGDYAFDLITATSSKLRLPSGMDYIGERAFSGVKGLSGEVVYPSSLTEIKSNVLAYTDIESIIYGKNIRSVEPGAFGYMSSLKKVTFTGAFPDFEENYFKNFSSKLTVYYPIDDDTWYEGIKGLNYNSEIVEFVPTGSSTTVTFIDFTGKVYTTQSVTPNTKVKAPSVTTLNGKKVGGWYTNKTLQYDATRWNFDTPVKNKITLYAGETYTGHRVVFYPKNGSDPIIQNVKDGECAKEIEVKRDGYRFYGWYEKGPNGTRFDFKKPVDKDIALDGTWIVFRPRVTFKSNGYDYIPPYTNACDVGTKFSDIQNWISQYEKDGYAKLVGWYTDEKLTKPVPKNFTVTEDMTVYGKWNVVTHKVTFVYGKGMKDVVVEVPHLNDLSLPDKPTVSGYHCDGWYLDPEYTQRATYNRITDVTKDLFVYAKWEANEITVSFRLYYDKERWTGYFSYITAGQTLKEAVENINNEYYPPMGYAVSDWYLDENYKKKISEDTKLYESTTVYGKLVGKTYNLTIDPANGEAPYTIKAEHGKKVDIKTPVREGYIFDGWLDTVSNSRTYEIYYVYADAKYKAQWREKLINVNFEVISADGTTKYYYRSIKAGSSVSEAIEQFITLQIPSGQELVGWFGDQKCTKLIQMDTRLYEKITIYGKLRIKPARLSVYGISDMPYTGKAVTLPNFKVTDGEYELINGKDYTVKYSNNVNAGVATITITYKGNYKGKNVLNFNITKGKLDELKDAGIITSSFEETVLAYNKKVQKVKPVISFKSGGKKVVLKENRDYKLVYIIPDKNVENMDTIPFKDPGKYTLEVVGMGSFEGSFKLSEVITADKLVGKLTVTRLKKSYSYTGEEIEPSFTVKDGKNVIAKCDENGFSSDFLTCKFESNKELGTAKIRLTAIEGLGYAGSRTLAFSITGTPLSKVVFDGFVAVKDYDDGKEVKQTDVVLYKSAAYKKAKDDAGKLQEGKDYSVTYKNFTEVGTATVIYTGLNGYYGTVKKTFTIKGKDLRKAKVTGIVNYKYTGSEITQTGLLVSDPVSGIPLLGIEENAYNKLSPDKQRIYHYIVRYSSNLNKGTAKVTIKGVNLYSGTITKNFKILARNLSDIGNLECDTYEATYNKKGCKPSAISVVAHIDGKEILLTKGTDYKVTIANNMKAGKEATITVTGLGNYTGKLMTTYKVTASSISQFHVVVTRPAYKNAVGNFACKVSVYDLDWNKLTQGVDYKVTYTQGTQVLNPKKKKLKKGESYSYKIEGINNYSCTGSEYSKTITLDSATYKDGEYDPPKAISTYKAFIKDYYCTGTAIKPQLSDILVIDKNGKRISSQNYEIIRIDNNVNVGTATVVLKGKSYLTGQIKVKFKILPKPVDEKSTLK